MTSVMPPSGHVNNDLEHQLYLLGIPVGEKILELLFYREKGGQAGACSSGKRETRIVNMLHFINKEVFKALFGKSADGLEQSVEDEDEYRILDRTPLTNRFANMGGGGKSVGAGGSGSGNTTNCAAYIAGMIEGMLSSSKLYCKVTAHLIGEEGGDE